MVRRGQLLVIALDDNLPGAQDGAVGVHCLDLTGLVEDDRVKLDAVRCKVGATDSRPIMNTDLMD